MLSKFPKPQSESYETNPSSYPSAVLDNCLSTGEHHRKLNESLRDDAALLTKDYSTQEELAKTIDDYIKSYTKDSQPEVKSPESSKYTTIRLLSKIAPKDPFCFTINDFGDSDLDDFETFVSLICLNSRDRNDRLSIHLLKTAFKECHLNFPNITAKDISRAMRSVATRFPAVDLALQRKTPSLTAFFFFARGIKSLSYSPTLEEQQQIFERVFQTILESTTSTENGNNKSNGGAIQNDKNMANQQTTDTSGNENETSLVPSSETDNDTPDKIPIEIPDYYEEHQKELEKLPEYESITDLLSGPELEPIIDEILHSEPHITLKDALAASPLLCQKVFIGLQKIKNSKSPGSLHQGEQVLKGIDNKR